MNKLLVFLVLALGTLAPARAQTPLSLDACVDYALLHAPELTRRTLAYSNQTLTVESAAAKYLPRLDLSSRYAERSGDTTLEGALSQTLPGDLDLRASASQTDDDAGDDPVRYALRLSKTLLGGGSLLESNLILRKANLDEAVNWNNLSRETRRIRFTVTRAYNAVVRNQQTIHLRQLQLERARRNLEHALVQEEPLDIANARLRIPESELDVVRAQRSVTNAIYELKEVIGMPMDLPLMVQTSVVYQARAIDAEGDLLRALDEHEDVRNAELELEKRSLDATVAATKTWPELKASVVYEDGEGDEESDTRAELSLSWAWMDKADRAAAQIARNQVREAELTLFDTRQTLSRSIRSLAMRLLEAERAVELQEEQVRVLEQQLLLYQDRWENGEIEILEFIRSQRTLEDARVQLVNQKTGYMELLAEYDFQVGR